MSMKIFEHLVSDPDLQNRNVSLVNSNFRPRKKSESKIRLARQIPENRFTISGKFGSTRTIANSDFFDVVYRSIHVSSFYFQIRINLNSMKLANRKTLNVRISFGNFRFFTYSHPNNTFSIKKYNLSLKSKTVCLRT